MSKNLEKNYGLSSLDMIVEEKKEVSPEKFKVLPRHIIINGSIQNDFIVNLTHFVSSFITQDIVEPYGPSYFLVKPRKTWTETLIFNVPNAVWSDTMDFYIVLKNEKDSRDANLVLNHMNNLETVLESNDDYLIFGYYAKKTVFDQIDINSLRNIPSFHNIIPSFHFREGLEFKYFDNRIDEKEDMKIWAINLPDEPKPNNRQLCSISFFNGFHNFILNISEKMFRITGKEESYESMYDKKEELAQQLETNCKILLFCTKCDQYVDNIRFAGTGSKYQCQNMTKNNVKCHGLCVMNK